MKRRNYLALMGAAAGAVATSGLVSAQEPRPADPGAPTTSTVEDRKRRMKWWHEAKFGMFIHWGLYSTLGRHEWVMENEGIPAKEYEQYANNFKPKPNFAQAWAQLAKRTGMKYMVMTTKHHEGFCNFDSKLTNYCATKKAPGRDLVKEYVEAARAEGLRVGFYYSLMDWHHPDGARCLKDEAARRRFVDYIHGQVRELMTNYGTIDILWYDVPWPLDAKGWESVEMNTMVRKLQPDVIINNRSKIPEDFDTPEQRIEASVNRPWESCMTLNDSWGYHISDRNWKSPTTVIRNLITCARDGGNYLLNIGPTEDGSIPAESVQVLSTVGEWMAKHGDTIRLSDNCQPRRGNYLSYTRRGNTLYAHVHYWPGETVVIANLLNKVTAVTMHGSNTPVKFEQDDFRIRLTGLPKRAPELVTTFALECESEPKQSHEGKRAENHATYPRKSGFDPYDPRSMIDAHQHFWQLGRFDYPWMSAALGVLYRDYLPTDLEPILKQNRIEKTVLVQASNSVEESRWLLDLAENHAFIAGVVGWVDLTSTAIDSQLDELCVHPKFKGVRHLVESEPNEDWLTQPIVLSGLQKLAARGLSYDLLVHTRHLKYMAQVAESCPGVALVIDHLAKPPIARGDIKEWSRAFKPLASYPNIHCKLSGLVTEASWHSWRVDDLRPFVDCALEFFGADRMMFGSDYPVCLLAASYDRVLDSFAEILKYLSDADREKIFANNAAKFYRLD